MNHFQSKAKPKKEKRRSQNTVKHKTVQRSLTMASYHAKGAAAGTIGRTYVVNAVPYSAINARSIRIAWHAG